MSASRTYRRRPAARATFLLALCATFALPVAAAAQQGCEYGEGTRSVHMSTLPGGGRITYLSRPRIFCDEGVTISADSAVSYSQLGYSDLMGHVRYRDRQRVLRADEARYFNQQARLQAHGSVFVEDSAQGSIIRNGDLVYLRQSDTRKQEEMTVTTGADGVRPHATLYMQPAADTTPATPAHIPAGPDTGSALADTTSLRLDTTALKATLTHKPPSAPAPDTASSPYDVVADRIQLQGDQYFRATGRVVIHRDSLNAHSDTAEYDQVAGRLLLQGQAHVESSSYDLNAERISIGVPGGAIRDVRAMRHAVLVGQDLRLTSPLIHMFLKDGMLDRLVAIPLPRDSASKIPRDSADTVRPIAVAEKFHLTADSLEVNAPDQELKRIFASGDARGTSDARDSLNTDSLPEVARKDWVRGDTVIVTFVPVPPDRDSVTPPPPGQDTARTRYEVDHLVAAGHARSLYRLEPSDSTARAGIDPPAIHYATGTRITLVMKEGEVDRMEVEGPTQGWHFEPNTRPATDTLGASDSLRAHPDTATSRSDTIGSARRAGRSAGNRSGGSPGGQAPRRGVPRAQPWLAGVPASSGRVGRLP